MFRVILAPIYILLLAGLAQAQEPPKPPTPRDAIKQILDLTDQQVQQLIDLRQSHQQQKIRVLTTQMRSVGQKLRDLLQSTNPDPAQIGALALQERSLGQQVKAAQMSYHEAALALLTETQKQKVAQIQEALKLAPQAGPLAAFGLIIGPRPGPDRPGMRMLREFFGGPRPLGTPPPPEPPSGTTL